MQEYIPKQEAFEILSISSYQHLRRIVKKHDIKTKSLGIGKPTLYLKTDICNAVVKTKDTKKFAPKKPQVKAKEKKEKKQTEAKELEQKKKEVEEKTKNPLNKTGQDEYLRVEKELKDKGLYLESDRAYLLVYAIAYQNYMFYVDLSASLDHTSQDQNGGEKVHPYFTVADRCFNQMEKAATKLGIGARNRIGLEIKQPKTGLMADILNKRGK